MAATSATLVGVLATGVGLGMLQVANLGAQVWRKRRDDRVVFRHETNGFVTEVTAGDLDDLELRIPESGTKLTLILELTREDRPSLMRRSRHVAVEGPQMMTLAGLAMARHNRTAGKPQRDLQESVELLDRAGNPFASADDAEAWLDLQAARTGERYPPSGFWRGRLHLWRLDTPMRLALEMAAHRGDRAPLSGQSPFPAGSGLAQGRGDCPDRRRPADTGLDRHGWE